MPGWKFICNDLVKDTHDGLFPVGASSIIWSHTRKAIKTGVGAATLFPGMVNESYVSLYVQGAF